MLPGTAVERLYKRAQLVHQSDENFDGTFVLTGDVVAPTQVEIMATQAEVGDEAFTQAVETIRQTIRSSGRQRVDAPKVKENKAQKQADKE